MKKFYVLLVAFLFLGIGENRAQIANLHSFTDFEYPYGSLTLSGNVLYGMTFYGGANGYGYVFSINTSGNGFTDLWDFDDTGLNGNANGSEPYGSLAYHAGVLYGMTYMGGSNNNQGVLFSLKINGNVYKDLWDFDDTGVNGNANGAYPIGTVTYDSGKLYGFTYEGGGDNTGLVFSLDTDGTHYKDIYDFFSGTAGRYPYYGSLAISVSGKTLYGTTLTGGANGDGNVYSIDTDGSRYKDLLDFDVTNGEEPYAQVILSGSELFGMTEEGGAGNDGRIFAIDTTGNNYKDIFDFDGQNGESPFGELTLQDSTLFGMTYDGGLNFQGNIFLIDSTGSGFIDLYDFIEDGVYGDLPEGDITLSGDTLFGMTRDGGTAGDGNIFSFDTNTITTSINKLITNKGGLIVYPNPNNGIFSVVCHSVVPKAGEESLPIIEIFNVLGENILTETIPHAQGDNIVNISNQPSGVYLYRIIENNGELVGEGKVVIQK